RGAAEALSETRPLPAVEADLVVHREELSVVREAAERLEVVAVEERRRRSGLVEERERLGSAARALDAEATRLDGDSSAHECAVKDFVQVHGKLESPAVAAAARAELAADMRRLARLLQEMEAARGTVRQCGAVVEPVARELGLADPGELFACAVEPAELESRTSALEERRARRDEVRRRTAEYEARAGADGVSAGDVVRPDLGASEATASVAAKTHVALVERRAVLVDRARVLEAGPAEVAEATAAMGAARLAFEQAKSVADRCAGLGGGPDSARLSLENWVLAVYLRQVLVQANQRLDAMTGGRFALELSDGVTDGRKPWGLDLAVSDANTGQVRPATTLSGGETFMAALALALGLADVVSGGTNREVGALFVDEGFGSLDTQSLDAVIEVLRSLEDGGRIVGVISHVKELHQALPRGITVEPSAGGSLAKVHYPPE
ncbi:MAG: SbcC/MukB-like Walker B domain-containing protein, partial [Acidimicrobiales bacterium]